MVRHKILRWVILALAVILIAVGIYTGNFADVFRKATMICYECVGIG